MPAPLRRLTASLLPVLLAAGLATGCGGGDDGQSATELLDRAFQNSIESADVDLSVEIALEGVEDVDEPVALALTGPYQSGGDDQLPSVDWDISVRAQDQTFDAGLMSTGKRGFISFQGTDYEASRQTMADLTKRVAESRSDESPQTLDDFGVTARDWVTDASEEGEEEIAGVETTHVSGRLAVNRMLEDLNTVVAQAAELGGENAAAVPPELTEEQRRRIEEVLDDPRFDVYVGKDDEIIRRLSADLEFSVPEDSRENLRGLEGGRISFSIEFADVGGDKTFAAPEDARPMEDLTRQLRGLVAGAVGAPQSGQAPGTAPGQTPAPPADPGAVPREKREQYEECVAARPDDPQIEAWCAVLLQ